MYSCNSFMESDPVFSISDIKYSRRPIVGDFRISTHTTLNFSKFCISTQLRNLNRKATSKPRTDLTGSCQNHIQNMIVSRISVCCREREHCHTVVTYKVYDRVRRVIKYITKYVTYWFKLLVSVRFWPNFLINKNNFNQAFMPES